MRHILAIMCIRTDEKKLRVLPLPGTPRYTYLHVVHIITHSW
jgi:hypothetical protein